MRYLLAAALLLVAGCHVHGGNWPPCDSRRSLSEQIDAAGASSVKIVARAGSLRIIGAAGLERLEASAEACAPDESALDDMQLLVERRGDQLYLETVMGQTDGWRHGHRVMDLAVSLPDSLPVEVVDKSGDLRLENVAGAKIDDKSGDVVVVDVHGSLQIEDKSGDIRVDQVAGDVRVNDKSGEVRIANIGGDVVVEDKSGDIIVRDVAGDLSVPEDGSGDVDHANVAGRVEIDD